MISYIDDRNECRSGRDLIFRDWVVTSRTNSVLRRVILSVSRFLTFFPYETKGEALSRIRGNLRRERKEGLTKRKSLLPPPHHSIPPPK